MQNNIINSNLGDNNRKPEIKKLALPQNFLNTRSSSASCEIFKDPNTILTPLDSRKTSNLSTISVTDLSTSQQQILVPTCAPKLILPLLPSSRPCLGRNIRISSLPNSKMEETSKTKPSIKYLLKIIELSEDPVTKEVILVFEITLPVNQARFSCSLNNDLNCLDLSKLIGDSGQFTEELRNKDILESLRYTLKKLCDLLLQDINSISLNEDYVFHPSSEHSNLIKFSDSIYQMQTSSNMLPSNHFNYINNTWSSMQGNLLNWNCISPICLSRQMSNEDLKPSIPKLSISLSDLTRLSALEIEILNSIQSNPDKTMVENSKLTSNFVCDTNLATNKCNCSNLSKDCCIKIPDFLSSSVKLIVEKLKNPLTKGFIILPQSNEMIPKNLRILEIPADQMIFGLPISDSLFTFVKGQKDKDFIIANDTRQSENSDPNKKCVYQVPANGVVLLDSSGEIQYLRNPAIIIPHAQSKAQVQELPFQFRHNNMFNFGEIVSKLQSLSTGKTSHNLIKDETFDSPVILENTESQRFVTKKNKNSKDLLMFRQSSLDSLNIEPVSQNQIQVECVSFHYVPLPKSSISSKTENIDISGRDLPRKLVQNIKMSNESLDTFKSHSAHNYLNEIDHNSNIQQLTVTNQINSLQDVQRTPFSTRSTYTSIPKNTTASKYTNQYMITPQNQIPQNIFVQNMPFYGTNTIAATKDPTASIAQAYNMMHVMIPNSNPLEFNYPPAVSPNIVMLTSGGMLPNQMVQVPPVNMQQYHSANSQKMSVPGLPSSIQQIANLQSLQMKNVMDLSQPMLPVYNNLLHRSMPNITSEQHFVPVSYRTDFINYNDQVRQMSNAPVNIRHMYIGNSPYYDNRFVSQNDPYMGIRYNQLFAQPQSQKLISSRSNIITPAASPFQTNPLSTLNQAQFSVSEKSQMPPVAQFMYFSNPTAFTEPDNIPKPQQTLGRFIIRQMTENFDKS